MQPLNNLIAHLLRKWFVDRAVTMNVSKFLPAKSSKPPQRPKGCFSCSKGRDLAHLIAEAFLRRSANIARVRIRLFMFTRSVHLPLR